MKPRWMTPSADEAPRLRPSRSARSPRCTSAPAALTADADASERAEARVTRWPARSSSGTTAEPTKPLAPVTKDTHALMMRASSRLSQIGRRDIKALRDGNVLVARGRFEQDSRRDAAPKTPAGRKAGSFPLEFRKCSRITTADPNPTSAATCSTARSVVSSSRCARRTARVGASHAGRPVAPNCSRKTTAEGSRAHRGPPRDHRQRKLAREVLPPST